MEWAGLLLGPSPTSEQVTERAELSLPPRSTPSQSPPPRQGPEEPAESLQPPRLPSAHSSTLCPVAKKRVELTAASLTLRAVVIPPATLEDAS